MDFGKIVPQGPGVPVDAPAIEVVCIAPTEPTGGALKKMAGQDKAARRVAWLAVRGRKARK